MGSKFLPIENESEESSLKAVPPIFHLSVF